MDVADIEGIADIDGVADIEGMVNFFCGSGSFCTEANCCSEACAASINGDIDCDSLCNPINPENIACKANYKGGCRRVEGTSDIISIDIYDGNNDSHKDVFCDGAYPIDVKETPLFTPVFNLDGSVANQEECEVISCLNDKLGNQCLVSGGLTDPDTFTYTFTLEADRCNNLTASVNRLLPDEVEVYVPCSHQENGCENQYSCNMELCYLS